MAAIGVAARAAGVIGGATRSGKIAWDLLGLWDLFDRTVAAVSGRLPKVVHGINVRVVGGPKAHVRRLWYLALSAAFGRFRDALTNNDGEFSIAAYWAISEKAASVEIVYIDNGWGTGSILTDLGHDNAPNQTPIGRLARGPEQLTVGGSWPGGLAGAAAAFVPLVNAPVFSITPLCAGETGAAVPYSLVGGAPNEGTGLVGSGTAGGTNTFQVNSFQEYPDWGGENPGAMGGYLTATRYVWGGVGPLEGGFSTWQKATYASGLTEYYTDFVVPGATPGVSLCTLPDDGRVITTVEPNDPFIQPPRPIIDGQTRSSLVSLVAQAILQPCFLPQTPPCTGMPVVSSGRYVWAPGGAPPTPAGQQTLIGNSTTLSTTKANIGPDGYPYEPNTGLGIGVATNIEAI